MNVNWLQAWAACTPGMRVTILFLFVLTARLTVFVGKGWWILGFSYFRTRRSLGEVASAAGTQNLIRLKLLAPGFREHTLEGGLRQLRQIDTQLNFNEILEGANRQFQDLHGRLDLSLANLSRWRNLTLWVLAAGLLGETANVMLEPTVCRFGDIADGRPLIPWIASIGLWLIAALYIIQWRFTERLRIRAIRWKQFVSEVKSINP